ncbi:MAG: TetR/AcrR family transcriptional regulator [Anaerolineales bacterium]|jgi:AcrR family transcriptional regulator
MDTKQKILDVSLRMFMQVGFENTYMDDVAQNAGVTKPAIYYYFKDKQALFEAAAQQFLEQMAQMMSPEGEAIPPLEGLLVEIFGSLPEWLGRYQRMSGIEDRTSLLRSQVFVYDAMTRIPDFRSAFAALYRDSEQLLRQACEEAARRGEIRPEIDMYTLGILINSMIEGLLLMAMVDPQMDLEELGHKGADALWRMLKA